MKMHIGYTDRIKAGDRVFSILNNQYATVVKPMFKTVRIKLDSGPETSQHYSGLFTNSQDAAEWLENVRKWEAGR